MLSYRDELSRLVNILYLHQYFNTPDMPGGTRSYELARRLVRAGHRVQVVTSDRNAKIGDRGWRRTIESGIEVHWTPIPYSNRMGFAARILAFVRFAFRASRHSARLESDVVFATSTPLTIVIPAIAAKRWQRIPMVFEVRDLWPETPIAVGAIRNPMAKACARWLEQLAYREAVEIVALSPGMAQGVSTNSAGRCSITVIPNAADIEGFHVPAGAGSAFRAQHDWLRDRPLVLYAGAFGKVNGVHFLVEVAREMLTIDPEIAFLVVGEGAEKRRVIDCAAAYGIRDRNFFVWDAMPKREMVKLFSAASVVTSLVVDIPALWKNSANKFFDGLAAGRPVAINHGGWMADMLNETGAGLVLPAGDARAAALSLQQRIRESGWIERSGAAAAELARSRFDQNDLALKLEKVLLRATRQRA